MRVAQDDVVAAVLKAKGYPSLNPTQKAAVDSGLLEDGSNFVVASPTASGKTVIGELAILEAVKKGSMGVYSSPSVLWGARSSKTSQNTLNTKWFSGLETTTREKPDSAITTL